MITDREPETRSYGEATDTALKLFVVLYRAHRAITERVRRSLENKGLGETEFAVLEVLYHKGRLLVGEVGSRVLLTSGSTTYVIDKLEKRGLVARRPCESDRRALYVELTPAGEELIAGIFPAHAEEIRRAMQGLTLEEQRIATALLRRLGMEAGRHV